MFVTCTIQYKNFFPLSYLVVACHCMVVYKCKTSKCMIKQIRSNFVDKKCFITNVSIELPCKPWIFLKMVTKPKLTNIIKILHFLWKQIVLRFLMQFYKVFQSEDIYIYIYLLQIIHKVHIAVILNLFKTVTSARNFPWN